jgi:glycosyltransferase involved in cell wall biosynthesis
MRCSENAIPFAQVVTPLCSDLGNAHCSTALSTFPPGFGDRPSDPAMTPAEQGPQEPHVARDDGPFPDSLRLLAILPSIPLGGMERAAIRVMQEMQLLGAQVHVLTNRRWGGKVRAEVAFAGLEQSGIAHIASLGRPRSWTEWRATAVSFLVTGFELARAHRRHRANALLATSLHVAWFARRLARWSGNVSIFRVPNPPFLGRKGIRAKIDRAIWRSVGANFDYLVCNSHYTAGLVSEVTGQSRKVVVVRNFAPNLNRQIETPAPIMSQGRQRVVFLGQIAEHKGVGVLFEAAQLILRDRVDLDFILAGPQFYLDPFKSQLEAKIHEAGLGDRFRMIGPIDDVQGLLRQCDVHVCPSISSADSFPNVVLDAKQAALPTIALPAAGLPEAVEHGVTGIVTADYSSEGLADALASLLDKPDRLSLIHI